MLETLCFRITRHCNLTCTHCRAGSSPQMRDHANVDEFLAFASRAKKHVGLRHVSISGGEPAMDTRLIYLVTELAQLALHVTITTNGTMPLSARLLPIFQCFPNFVRVRVSVDGSQAVHDGIRGAGTYEKATNELRLILSSAGWVGLNTVITKDVFDSVADLTELAIRHQVPEWALISPVPQGTAFGMPWSADVQRPLLFACRDRIRGFGYAGRLRIWDYLSTPLSSVLVEPSGVICLSGIRDDDAIAITTVGDCDFTALASAVRAATGQTDQSHFRWTGWT